MAQALPKEFKAQEIQRTSLLLLTEIFPLLFSHAGTFLDPPDNSGILPLRPRCPHIFSAQPAQIVSALAQVGLTARRSSAFDHMLSSRRERKIV
jgi:hypothetical protein